MLASSVVLGGLAGLALRGRWRNFRELEIHWWPVAVLALGARVLGVVIGLPVAVHVAAILLTALVAARNWRITGTALVALGSALNAAAIIANGAMPFDTAAATAVGAAPLLNDSLHVPLDGGTRLPWLADVIPVAIFRNVYSIGDVLIAAGGFCIPFFVLRRK